MYKELLEYFNGDELAAKVWKDKYAMKDELTPQHMHIRLAKQFAKAEREYKNPIDEATILHLFENFKYIIPQGSVMFGLGNKKVNASLSNCVVVNSPYDSYGGIMKTDEELVQLMKRRCGVGVDISTLRPKNAIVNNAAKTSTGAVSFMHRFSNTTREVAQEARRGALMLSMHDDHPDILEFIKIKDDLTKVTGANISVQISDKFMNAVQGDKPWTLHFDDGTITAPTTVIRAKEMWDILITQAHKRAEPGLMFSTKQHKYSTSSYYPGFENISSNPCFRGDMTILTDNGYKTFNDLDGSNHVLINKNGKKVKGKVWNSGIKDIYEINCYNKRIYSTADHKYLTTNNELVEAKDLVGKRLMPNYKINKQSKPLYVALGFAQGDGNLTRLNSKEHKGYEINIGKNDGQEIANLFNITFEKNKHSYYIRTYKKQLIGFKFSSEKLPNRTLPKSFNYWLKGDKLSFLRGLYSANGSVIKKYRISFKSTCKELILELQEVLRLFEINTYITTNKSKVIKFANGDYKCKESYDLNIGKFEDILRFSNKIGFVQKYKNNDLEDLILAKSYKVRSVKYSSTEPVFDFTLYDDTHIGIVEGVKVSNCSEIMMGAYDTCRLIAMNMFSFVDNPFTESAEFNFIKWSDYVYIAQKLNDDLVDLESKAINRIIDTVMKSKDPTELKVREVQLWNKLKENGEAGRRTGLGFTGLGDTLAALGLPYGGDASNDMVYDIMKAKMIAEFRSSIDMSRDRGHFKGFNKEIENKSEFIKFFKMLEPNLHKRMMRYGRRNISISTVAPTGSLSLLAGTTSGIEPIFKPYYTRRKKINPNEEGKVVAFIDKMGDSWEEFTVIHPKFKNWLNLELKRGAHSVTADELNSVNLGMWFKASPWYQSTANDIDWKDRLEMQSVIQQFTTHSISSTINLPKETTKEEIGDIYMLAWELGLKGITVYVDGSRDGVLITKDTKEDDFEYHDAAKRPRLLDCDIHLTTYRGTEFVVYVGLLAGKPYEVFALENTWNIKPSTGYITKKGNGRYDVQLKDDLLIEDITSEMTHEEESITRMLSFGLRHGGDITFAVEQLRKAKGDITSFSKAIARVLNKYVKERDTNVKCPECGDNLILEEGCSKCGSCGFSRC